LSHYAIQHFPGPVEAGETAAGSKRKHLRVGKRLRHVDLEM